MTDKDTSDRDAILAAIRESKHEVRDDVAGVYAHLKQDIIELKKMIEKLREGEKA